MQVIDRCTHVYFPSRFQDAPVSPETDGDMELVSSSVIKE